MHHNITDNTSIRKFKTNSGTDVSSTSNSSTTAAYPSCALPLLLLLLLLPLLLLLLLCSCSYLVLPPIRSLLSHQQQQDAHSSYDNAPIHSPSDNCKQHETLIARYGHMIKRLCPYSPFLNPIEEVFSEWKRGVERRQAHEAAALEAAANAAMQDITTEHIMSYYNHAQSYYTACIDKQDIVD